MSSRLQLDIRNLGFGMRHLVNAYEVEAGTVYFAGNTVWSVPEPQVLSALIMRYYSTIKALYKSTVHFV